MGYYHPAGGKGTQKELADMYGVQDVNQSNRPGAYAKPGNENRTSNEVERDIRGAMMDDYSTREYLKYNTDVRDEANEIKGLREQNAFIHDSMRQAHKDAGNGGKYSSDGDRGGVAREAFQSYEKEQRSYVDDQLDKMRSEMPSDADTGAAESAAENMTYGEYLESKNGDAAKAGAQKMAGDTVRSIASNRGAIAKGKAKQGQYVLSNLGSEEYQGGN